MGPQRATTWHTRIPKQPGISMCQQQNFGNNNRNTGFQDPNIQGQTSQPHSQRSHGKILGSSSSHHPNNHSNSYFSRGNQDHYDEDHRRNTSAGSSREFTRGGQHNQHSNQPNSNFRNYGHNKQRGVQSHTRFDEKYNQQYSPPIYPPTPPLNSSFPEALS